MKLGKYKIMFISGGWSIDHRNRTPGFDWFPDEQLSEDEFELAKKEYIEFKPDILLTHEGPIRCISFITSPEFARYFGYTANVLTRTSIALDELINLHPPIYHIFCHYHKEGGKNMKFDNCPTEFIHLDMIRANTRGFIYPGSTFDLEI